MRLNVLLFVLKVVNCKVSKMVKPAFICIVLVLVFLEFSSGFSAENTLTQIEDFHHEVEETADNFEDILDYNITPLVDKFYTIFDDIEELLKKGDKCGA